MTRDPTLRDPKSFRLGVSLRSRGTIQHRPDRRAPRRGRYRGLDGRQQSKSFNRMIGAERWLRAEPAWLDQGQWVDCSHQVIADRPPSAPAPSRPAASATIESKHGSATPTRTSPEPCDGSNSPSTKRSETGECSSPPATASTYPGLDQQTAARLDAIVATVRVPRPWLPAPGPRSRHTGIDINVHRLLARSTESMYSW